MKANKTVKMLMALVLSFAMVLGTMMVPAMAANVGDTVNVDAEFGAFVIDTAIDTSKANATTNALSYTSISAKYYTNYHESAYYAVDDVHGNIAVMKKGVADTETGTNRGAVLSGIKYSVAWEDKTNLSDEFIFDLYFKVPVADGVTTYLFNGDNARWSGKDAANYANLVNGSKNSVKVENGYIYLSGDYENAINETALSADTWYRMVRQVKGGFNGNTKVLFEKVLVLDSNNKIVAQTSEWAQVGNGYTAGSANAYACLTFATDYPTNYTGTEAAVSTMKLYKNPVVTASASLSGSNRVLEYDASGNDINYAPVAERISGYSHNFERQNAYVTFRLPEGNGTMKFFRWNDANGKYAGVGTEFADSFAVTVEGGKVYANIYNANSLLNGRDLVDAPAKSFIKLYETTEGSGVYYTKTDLGITLDANKWYTIEIKRTNMFDNTAANILNIYDGKVENNNNGTVTGSLIKTWGGGNGENFILPFVNDDYQIGTRTASGQVLPTYATGNRTITFFAGYGYEKPVYIDAMTLEGWEYMTSANIAGSVNEFYGVTNNWTYGYDGSNKNAKEINIGDQFVDFRMYNANSGNWVNDLPATLDAKVVYDSEFLLTGVTYTRTMPTIKVEFSAPISWNDSVVTITDATGGTIDFDASYDAASKTATLSNFDRLAYGGVYTININVAKTPVFGFDTTSNAYTFECKDAFVISNAKVVDDSDADVTASPAVDTVINGAVTLQNLSDEARPYVVILALYKGTMMVDAVAESDTISAGAIVPVETPTITVGESGCSMKVMVWDSWSNIMPKCGAYTVPAPAAN